jgi:hypothetical protein
MRAVWVVEEGDYDPVVVGVFTERDVLMDWLQRKEHALSTRILAEDDDRIVAETDFPFVLGVTSKHTARYQATKWPVR